MRLTPDLINNSLSYLNPLKERELDLRGHKIPTIENLGVAGPQDAIDFTDNDITSVSNFPLSPRLATLLLARNRVRHFQPNLVDSLPNLHTLVLTHNNIAELADLDPLGRLVRLTHLTLLENPVVRKEHYRSWILWRMPSIRFLDFQKVRNVERIKATALFGTHAEPSALASKIMGVKSRTFDVGAVVTTRNGKEVVSVAAAAGEKKIIRATLTDTERRKVEEMIRKATTLQEITRLEKDLNEGRVPAGAADGEDRMDM